MSNKAACIIGTILFFPGLFIFFYLIGHLDTTSWLMIPTIFTGSIYLTVTGLMAYGGLICWLGE